MARKKKLLGEEFGKMVLSRTIATYRKSNQRWKITFSDEKMEELDNILSNGMGLLDGVQVTVF